jgi:histidine triad (HIT) family protein
MSHNDCVFCKIIAGTIPAIVIAQNDDVIVIQDRVPKTPIHYLIIPKKHIQSIQTLQADDASLVGAMMLMAQEVAKKTDGASDFRLLANNGAGVGQSVFHLHFHFLAGKKMSDF